MSKRDLVVAQTKVKRTGYDAEEYEREQYMRKQQVPSSTSSDGPAINPALLQQLAAFAQVLTGVNHHNSNGGQPFKNDDEDDDDDANRDDDGEQEDYTEIPQLF